MAKLLLGRHFRTGYWHAGTEQVFKEVRPLSFAPVEVSDTIDMDGADTVIIVGGDGTAVGVHIMGGNPDVVWIRFPTDGCDDNRMTDVYKRQRQSSIQ